MTVRERHGERADRIWLSCLDPAILEGRQAASLDRKLPGSGDLPPNPKEQRRERGFT